MRVVPIIMPCVSNLPIKLRLLRVDEPASKDDIITISGNDNIGYSITYVDNFTDTKKGSTTHETLMYMSGEEVNTYLESLISLLLSDLDPFYGLQIQAPGFPNILLPIPALRKKKTQHAIFNLLPLLTNFWKA